MTQTDLEATQAEVNEEQLVVFTLNNEAYGVDVATVREIIRMQDITEVPRTPSFVEGVINLRGKIIPVVDLRKRFGFATVQHDQDSRIMVVDTGGQDVGMIVDSVTEVLRITDDAVEPPSSVVTEANADYLRGIIKLTDRLIILLDLDRVLSAEEKTTLAGTATAASGSAQ
ncbi:MAG: chemotaxis protein CheW [Dehalococcoidia bacterium]|nr:chemotaxis protein CheW [Dehalococcoidia bacterium]